MTILTAEFFAHLKAETRRILDKDSEFASRLAGLQDSYGGGTRLQAELDELRLADQAFVERLGTVDWTDLADRKTREFINALHDLPAPAPGADITFFWDGEFEEIRLQSRARGPRFLKARNEALGFGEVFTTVLGLTQASGKAYPIIFSHDMERNQRLILISILGALGQTLIAHVATLPEWAATPFRDVGRISFTHHDQTHLLVDFSAEADHGPRFTTAPKLGWKPERELARGLDDYLEQDPIACFNQFRQDRVFGEFELRDFRDHLGATWQVVLEREAGRLTLRHRDRPIVTRRRANHYVDPAPVEQETLQLESTEELDATLEQLVREHIGRGYRLVYAHVRAPLGQDRE